MFDQKPCTYQHSQNKWTFIFSRIKQKSQRTEGAILHLKRILLFGSILRRYLYWKARNLTSIVHFKAINLYIIVIN